MKISKEWLMQAGFAAVRIGGPIVTAILGIKAGQKIQQYKVEMDYNREYEDGTSETLYFDELTGKEKFKYIAPALIPPFVAAGATVAIGCIDKKIDAKRIAEMTSLCAATMASNAVYRGHLQLADPDKLEEADKQAAIAKEKALESYYGDDENAEEAAGGPNDIIVTDSLTGRQFKTTLKKAEKAISDFIFEFNSNAVEMYGSPMQRSIGLYKLYQYLGIRNTFFGEQFGFVSVYNKDDNVWDYNFMYNDGKMREDDIRLCPDSTRPSHYILAYEEGPIEGWYEI